jgi:hypothetical protein
MHHFNQFELTLQSFDKAFDEISDSLLRKMVECSIKEDAMPLLDEIKLLGKLCEQSP